VISHNIDVLIDDAFRRTVAAMIDVSYGFLRPRAKIYIGVARFLAELIPSRNWTIVNDMANI
jgi:hypothetical protein